MISDTIKGDDILTVIITRYSMVLWQYSLIYCNKLNYDVVTKIYYDTVTT